MKPEKLTKYWKFDTIHVRTDAKAYEVKKSIDDVGLLIVGIQEVKLQES